MVMEHMWPRFMRVCASAIPHRCPSAFHSEFNYIAGLFNPLISSTCLIAVKVAEGPGDEHRL